MTESLIRYENPAPGVARIVMTRADKHNAINPAMIFAVNEGFDKALYDDTVKVIIFAADGRNFSAGHDIADTVENYRADMAERSPGVSGWRSRWIPKALSTEKLKASSGTTASTVV